VKRQELEEWQDLHGVELTLGTKVKISTTCEYYQPEYDQNSIYMVTYLYVDSGGLNIGINDGGDRWGCDADGYRHTDLIPAKTDNQVLDEDARKAGHPSA